MILQLGYKVFPKIGRSPLIDLHLNHVYSINLEEATV
jgi:hypothetical protein